MSKNFFCDVAFNNDGPSSREIFHYLQSTRSKRTRAPCNAVFTVNETQLTRVVHLDGMNIINAVGYRECAYLRDNGELYIGTEQFFKHVPVRKIAASNQSNSMLALTDKGLYRIPIKTFNNAELEKVEIPENYDVSDIKDISLGGVGPEDFFMVVFNDGNMYCAGEKCAYGQLGLGIGITITKLTFLARNVEKVFCGGWHTNYITTDGKVWAFGFNDDGRCAVGHNNTVYLPEQVVDVDGRDVEMFANGCFSALLTKQGDVYLAGNIIQRTRDPRFSKLKGLHNIIKVVPTLYSLMALNSRGEVFLYGNSSYSVPLGNGKVVQLDTNSMKVVDIGVSGSTSFSLMVWNKE